MGNIETTQHRNWAELPGQKSEANIKWLLFKGHRGGTTLFSDLFKEFLVDFMDSGTHFRSYWISIKSIQFTYSMWKAAELSRTCSLRVPFHCQICPTFKSPTCQWCKSWGFRARLQKPVDDIMETTSTFHPVCDDVNIQMTNNFIWVFYTIFLDTGLWYLVSSSSETSFLLWLNSWLYLNCPHVWLWQRSITSAVCSPTHRLYD